MVGCCARTLPGCCAALRYVLLSAAAAASALVWCCVALRCVALVCTLRYDIVIIKPNSRDGIHTASTYQVGRYRMRIRVRVG